MSMSEKELCVLCGQETPYTKETHISEREFYVEGSGQLCLKCHIKLYGNQAKKKLW